MHKLTEEQKLGLLQDDAKEFWQSLKITTDSTLIDVLQSFSKEQAKEDFKDVAKYKFDQMRYDTTTELFAAFLTKYKEAYGDKANDIAETFLFANCRFKYQTN